MKSQHTSPHGPRATLRRCRSKRGPASGTCGRIRSYTVRSIWPPPACSAFASPPRYRPDAFETVHRQVGPWLVRLELGRRDPVGHPRGQGGAGAMPGPRVRQQILAAFLGQGASGGAARRAGVAGLDRAGVVSATTLPPSMVSNAESRRAWWPVTDDDYGAALVEDAHSASTIAPRSSRPPSFVGSSRISTGLSLQERARQRDALPLAA